ncbi:MAG: ABC transporter substrate-binding protein [Phycisphaerae bacterium]|nr:ABC transporter substrate-binding protein [Phycisphaerae bacterium]
MPDERPTLTLAHSPDPDDAFMWWPITGKVAPGSVALGDGTPPDLPVLAPPVLDTGRFRFRAVPADIEALNRRAIGVADLDVTALSFRAYPEAAGRYALTACGSSFGEGFGPRIVCRKDQARDRVKIGCEGCLKPPHVRIAVPGVKTTAFLMLGLVLGPEAMGARGRFIELPFDRVIPAVASGRADAGLVIHEGQLLFEQAGLRLVLDVGAWWKERTGLPLPLGGNALRRDLDDRFGAGTRREVGATLHRSIEHALAHRDESIDYAIGFALANARTSGGVAPDRERVDRYVSMYVNRWTLDMGGAGREAVRRLLEEGARAGLCPDPGPIDVVSA